MTNNSEWKDANRELTEEQRRTLGDPPTAEEMLAYTRGELSEAEEERIRDLLVAYPEIARMFGAPLPEAPRPGDPDYVSPAAVDAAYNELRKRLPAREPRGRVLMFRHLSKAVAAIFAIVVVGLYVQAESRARYNERQARLPRILGAPQELDPHSTRGPGAPTMLRKDGEAYLLKPRLINQVRHTHYQLELYDANGAVIWTNGTAQPDQDDAFQIVVPHDFLRSGESYQLRIYGVDGETRSLTASYDLAVAAE